MDIKGFKFNKALGQNFIFDTNLLAAIVNDSNINKSDTVIEIGAGAGTLTKEIAKKAGRVIAFEVDKNLEPILNQNLAEFDNIEIHFKDILKLNAPDFKQLIGGNSGEIVDGISKPMNGNSEKIIDENSKESVDENSKPMNGNSREIIKEQSNLIDGNSNLIDGSSKESIDENSKPMNGNFKSVDGNSKPTIGRFKVVANLPYYITTPILFYFLEGGFDVQSITVMVQKEVAERIVAKEKSKDYGALTASVKARCDARITRPVSRKMFTPPPNVDSAVVFLDVLRPFDPFLSKVIRALFAMRRKTAVNNLTGAFNISKSDCERILTACEINQMARAEELPIDKIKSLAQKLQEI